MKNWITLGKLVTIKSGHSPSSFQLMDRGPIPYIKVEDMNNCTKYQTDGRQYTDDFSRSIPAGAIIFPKRGAAIMTNKVRIAGRELCMDTNMMAIVPNERILSEFLFNVIIYEKLYKIADTSTIPQINNKHINPYRLYLPPREEQHIIVIALNAWDTAIEKTERLIAAKESRYFWLLRELINKRTENNGWKKAKLGTLFEEVAEKVGDRELTPFSISAGIGFVSQKEKWGKDIAGQQYQNYTRLKNGEFAYNKGNSKKYACGCVYLLRDYEKICVPNVFICFRRKNDAVYPEFYEHYFIADYHARELRKYISSGARSDGLLNLSKNDFFKILVPFPPPEKQKFIADVLSTARQEIDLHKKQLAAIQKQKRGLMQKLLTGKWRVGSLINEKGNNDAQRN